MKRERNHSLRRMAMGASKMTWVKKISGAFTARTTLIVIMAVPGVTRPASASDDVHFTHGVASGDVTQSGAVLWTRINEETPIKIEVSRDLDFHELDFEDTVNVSAASDFTAKAIVTSLRPDTQYFYRWRHRALVSATGTFRTAPQVSLSS